MAKARRKAELSRAEQVIAFIEKYLVVPDGAQVGRPVVLRPWQKKIIAEIYDGRTRRAVVSMGRKNGKTALIAMLVLVHVVGPEARRNAQIYSAAQSRDQAAIVFSLAAKMVRMSTILNDLVNVRDSAKELFCHTTGVRYKALSADATTAYGLSPSLVIHDELGQVRGPRSELYEALETASGAQADPLTIIISTQAPNDDDLLSQLIDNAAASKDPRTKLCLFTADPADDPFIEATWRKANPALGDFQSITEMRSLADGAMQLPSQEAAFRNLNLNQRVAADESFISPPVWGLNAGAINQELFETGTVYVGVDLSATSDLTALVAVVMDSDGNYHVRPWFFIPGDGLLERARRDKVPYDVWQRDGFVTPTPGRSVNYDWVASEIVPVLSKWNVAAIAYDRWQFEHLKQAFARQGYEPPFLTDFGQGFKTMTPTLRTLEGLLLDAKVRHGDHPILRWNARNARTRPGDAGERKLSKSKSIGRIDGLVALAMAIGAAAAQEGDGRSVYEERGLILL